MNTPHTHLFSAKAFYLGYVKIDMMKKTLGSTESKTRLYGEEQHKMPQGKTHALTLQLIASTIVVLSVDDASLIGTANLEKKNVVVNYGFEKNEHMQQVFSHAIDSR